VHAAGRGPADGGHGGELTGSPPALADIERVFRAEYGRAVAVLARVLGDIDTAEDAVQDAFAEAARRWPQDGRPPSPASWIITTARNRAIDRLRREAARPGKHAQLLTMAPSPVAALNRAVALAEVKGPGAALAVVDGLAGAALDRYYLYHAIRADLLRRLGRPAAACAAYQAARALSGNAAERAHLALAQEHLAQPDGMAEAEAAEDADRHRREEPG
jgi:predicted RNA polymerase sigma factor